MFDESNDALSEDDKFSLYNESPTQDKDSLRLPHKKTPHNILMTESKRNP